MSYGGGKNAPSFGRNAGYKGAQKGWSREATESDGRSGFGSNAKGDRYNTDRVDAASAPWRGKSYQGKGKYNGQKSKPGDVNWAELMGKRGGKPSPVRPTQVDLVGIFVGDVAWLVSDVLIKRRGLSPDDAIHWLLGIAELEQPPTVVTGLEQVTSSEAFPFKCTQCPFFYVLEPAADADREGLIRRLSKLESLRFHCREAITMFPLRGASPRGDWEYAYEYVLPAYQRHMRDLVPDFFRPADWAEKGLYNPPDGPYMVEGVRVVPVFAHGNRWFVFLVRHSEALSSPEWTSVGGSTKCGSQGDQFLLDTAIREWTEEVLAFPWPGLSEAGPGASDHYHCHVRWKLNSANWENRGNWKRGDRGGVNSTAWIFVQVRPQFFERTCVLNETVPLVPESLDVARTDEDGWRHHTEGIPFAEHDVGGWFELVPGTGQLKSRFGGAEVRGDIGWALFGHRPSGGEGDQKSRDGIWSFMQAVQDRAVESSCSQAVPTFDHDVKISATGLRYKLEVFEEYFKNLSPVEATAHLQHVVSSALDRSKHHQFYYEEVQCCLNLGADPMEPIQGQSILACVLRNVNLNESIAAQSARLLCDALNKPGYEFGTVELDLLRDKISNAKYPKFKKQWSDLLHNAETHSN
eukprot:TRINITY_DN47363_c0_g1_i1.p1 TRINITY_DN47363_c0_g1~~TRINITY_DN47363_c0_g1_i1.p1  ORF type:complete len:635 (-),score=55.02 TRINITY_DN47363_c0_g1_i1:147-2051(-)